MAKSSSKGDGTGGGTGFQPVDHGQDAHGTSNHGLEGHATSINIRQGAYLPHWTRGLSVYSVTFRLADSLPQPVVQAWLAERKSIVRTAQQMNRPLSDEERKRLQYLFSKKVDKYLDAGHGACWMRRGEIACIVADALKHFDGDRYRLAAWCVMPNHVHVVVQLLPGHELENISHSWKSFTASQANRMLKRKGQFWQPESYDHLIRDGKDLAHSIEYVLDNPEKAGLKQWKWVGGSTDFQPVDHGQDAHGTTNHGLEGHATSNPNW